MDSFWQFLTVFDDIQDDFQEDSQDDTEDDYKSEALIYFHLLVNKFW